MISRLEDVLGKVFLVLVFFFLAFSLRGCWA